MARIVFALSGIALAVWLVSLGAVLRWERNDQARAAGAIVVLGAAQYVGRPSPVLRARLDHAIALWQRKLAPRMIVTGGTGTGDTTSEAAVSRRYCMQHGVPSAAILLETQGRTTSQSMAGVAVLMRGLGRRDVLLVSDPFHMLRLTILARRHGLEPYASPTPTSPIAANPSERWKYALSESIKAPLAFIFETRGTMTTRRCWHPWAAVCSRPGKTITVNNSMSLLTCHSAAPTRATPRYTMR